jgi:FkbM family methyltransferase
VPLNILALACRALRRGGRAGRQMRWRLHDALGSRQTVRARGLRFTLSCDNWITHYRTETFSISEPETLDWIDRRVRDGDVFFDVGGNVGVYTVYAALRHPQASIVVFEPEYANLHLLRDNIVANGLAARVRVYPIALSDRTGLSQLHVQDLTPGAALHSESAGRIGTTDAGKPTVMAEGTWAMRLDDFCAQAAVWPNALKIDVDGGEGRVLAGATETLARAGLRSVLVEAADAGAGLRPAECDLLRQAGFSRQHTDRRSPAGNEVWTR